MNKAAKISTILLFTIPVFAQTPARSDIIPVPVTKAFNGLINSVEWYDIPVWGAYLARNSVNPGTVGGGIKFAPDYIEQEFANSFRLAGPSPGSMDKNTIPDAIFFSRLAINFSLDVFPGTEITEQSYQKIFLFKKSLIYTYVLTEYVKNIIERERPDGSDHRSFFSGHTSTTFAAATFLYKEMHDVYQDWDLLQENPLLNTVFETVTFGTLYGWAGYVGYSRLKDKKHYLSDVVVGALVGSAISHLLYERYFGGNDWFLKNISFHTLGNNLAVGFQLKLD